MPELLTQSSLLVVTVVLVFVPTWPATLSFVPLPLLIWAALRFGPYLAALQVAFLAVVATTSTTRGTGPFAQHAFSLLPDPVQSGAHVQGYLVCAALMTLPTALASAHRIDLVRRLASERELSATTLDTTAAIIFVCDPAGTLLTCNAALTRITGFTQADVLGRKFWDCGLIPAERTDTVRAIFDGLGRVLACRSSGRPTSSRARASAGGWSGATTSCVTHAATSSTSSAPPPT